MDGSGSGQVVGIESGWLDEQRRESGQGWQHRDAVRHRARRHQRNAARWPAGTRDGCDAARRRRCSSIRALFPCGDVQFSGLAPGFAGLWQINVQVPSDAPPDDVIVFIIYGGVNSILDPNGIRRMTTIRTTP